MWSGDEKSRTGRWLETAWMVLATAALALHVGDWALVDPDEGRNAAIALEMMRSHDYLIPRLNEIPYLDKPALFFAVAAFAMQLFGMSELAVRLPSLLCAVATVALTSWFSACLFGRKTACIAGTVCATAPLMIIMARAATFDSMLSLWIVLALIAFYRSVETELAAFRFRGPLWTALAWTAMALGVMTKGPVALLIPLLVAMPFAIWRRKPFVIWHAAGWASFLMIVVPWVLAVESRMPGFLRYALVTETWQRLTTDVLDRSGPVWYFLPILLTGCLPWIVVVVFSGRLREALDEDRAPLIFLALWVVLPLLFFSLSQSKRPQYILPLIPAIALLVSWIWSGERPPERGVRAAALCLVLCGAALVLLSTMDRWPGVWDEFSAVGRRPLLTLGILTTASGVVSWLIPGHRRLSLIALSLPLMMIVPLTASLLSAVTSDRSSLELIAKLRPHLRPETVLVGVNTFVPSLTFYLEKSILLSTSTAEPMRSNYVLHAYDTLRLGSPTLRSSGFWEEAARSCTEPLIFLLRPQYKTERALLRSAGLPLLYHDRRVVAMGPCPPKRPVNVPQDAAK